MVPPVSAQVRLNLSLFYIPSAISSPERNVDALRCWNLAAIGTGVPNDWDSLILKRWDR